MFLKKIELHGFKSFADDFDYSKYASTDKVTDESEIDDILNERSEEHTSELQSH